VTTRIEDATIEGVMLEDVKTGDAKTECVLIRTVMLEGVLIKIEDVPIKCVLESQKINYVPTGGAIGIVLKLNLPNTSPSEKMIPMKKISIWMISKTKMRMMKKLYMRI
jgi:hypothetical protein